MVISNHVADVDVGFIQFALPARIRDKLATATRGEALEILRSPGPSTALDRAWLRGIYDRVQWTLGVALLNRVPAAAPGRLPQKLCLRRRGRRSRLTACSSFRKESTPKTANSAPFRTGVGLLASNLRIPILPTRIDGLFEIKNAGKKYATPGKIQVHIGKPMQFAPESKPEEIARALQKAVEEPAG